jgi:hypothetical protein
MAATIASTAEIEFLPIEFEEIVITAAGHADGAVRRYNAQLYPDRVDAS